MTWIVLLLLATHLLASVFWVGGMAFAYAILRPAAGALEPPVGLPLWRRVFTRFLPWVGVSVVALLVSGFGLIFLVYGGFKGLPLFINLMMTIGIVMMLLYGHLLFAPWRRFQAALDSNDLPEAARRLNQMRVIVGINLLLGVATLVIAGTGRYWGL